MDVSDLRAALHERAGTVTEHGAVHRVAQVRARVRATRRRRIAGAAALTAGVLALVSAVVTLPDRETGPADTGPEPAPLPTTTHEGFVSHSGGYDLVAAKIGEPGQNTLDLTIPAHPGKVHVTMTCHGVSGPSGGYWVSGYEGGARPARPVSYWCGGDPDVPAVPGVSGTAPGPWHYEEGFTLPPANEPVTVRVELTQEVDKDGVPLDRADAIGTYLPISHPSAVLGIGVYTVADPVTTVAGAEIPPRVGLDGQDYAYAEHRTSKPGEQELTWQLAPSAAVRYYDVVAADAVGMADPREGVQLVLDGTSCQSHVGFATFREGGCLLTPGEPHTITVTVDGDPLENALLGIVLYEATG